jgi:hypothetical protein
MIRQMAETVKSEVVGRCAKRVALVVCRRQSAFNWATVLPSAAGG